MVRAVSARSTWEPPSGEVLASYAQTQGESSCFHICTAVSQKCFTLVLTFSCSTALFLCSRDSFVASLISLLNLELTVSHLTLISLAAGRCAGLCPSPLPASSLAHSRCPLFPLPGWKALLIGSLP